MKAVIGVLLIMTLATGALKAQEFEWATGNISTNTGERVVAILDAGTIGSYDGAQLVGQIYDHNGNWGSTMPIAADFKLHVRFSGNQTYELEQSLKTTFITLKLRKISTSKYHLVADFPIAHKGVTIVFRNLVQHSSGVTVTAGSPTIVDNTGTLEISEPTYQTLLDGNIGIGTANPLSKLQIHGGTGEQSQGQIHIVGNGETGPGDAYISFYEGGESGSKWSLGAMDNDNSFSISHGLTMDAAPRLVINDATGNVGIGATAPIEKLSISDPTLSQLGLVNSVGNSWQFRAGSTGSLIFKDDGVERLRIDANGNLGIGTTSPSSELDVVGTITSQEVKVEVASPPDYVFAPEYQLRSLKDTEEYIKANSHLPEIPSAKEMEANGVELGEMNMLLLKKIEELTLHLIAKEKSENAMLIRIESLEKMIYGN